jgi:hypothetical protein
MNQCDLDIFQGDDWASMVTVLNCDGSPPDLTGYTAQAQIRSGPADLAPVAAEMTTTVVLPNLVSLYVPSDSTRQLRALYYGWDLQLTSPAGMITTILAGSVTVTQEVTRECLFVNPVDPGQLSTAIPVLPLPWLRASPFRARLARSVPQAR